MTLKELNEDEEYELDSIKGRAGAKKKMAVLNKGKVTKMELDELFLGDEKNEEV
jgi:hypothetical protein